MKNCNFFLMALLASVLLTNCAAPKTKSANVNSVLAEIEASKQRDLALQEEIESSRRLARISYKILTGAVELCGEKTRSSLGFGYWNKFGFKSPWRENAEKLFGLSSVLQVSYVIPDSPSEKATIKEGDILLAIDDWPLPVGKKSFIETNEKILEITKDKEGPIAIKFLRDGEEKTVFVEPEKICDYPVSIEKNDNINAFADGKRVVVSSGMMNFAQDDIELALIVSHELAHNSMGHIDAQKQNAMAGAAGGLLVDLLFAALGANTQGDFSRMGANMGAGIYSVEFEQEADYVGLYAMAISGYDIDEAPKFWRRMAARSPGSIQFKSTHPTTPERFVALEATVKEIKEKTASNKPLKPDMKEPASNNSKGSQDKT